MRAVLLLLTAALAQAQRKPGRIVELFVDGFSFNDLQSLTAQERGSVSSALAADVVRSLSLTAASVPADKIVWRTLTLTTIRVYVPLMLNTAEQAAVSEVFASGRPQDGWVLSELNTAARNLGLRGAASEKVPTPPPAPAVPCDFPLTAGSTCTEFAELVGNLCKCTETGYGCDVTKGICRKLRQQPLPSDDGGGANFFGILLLIVVVGGAVFCGGNCMFFVMHRRLPYWVTNCCLNYPPIFSCEKQKETEATEAQLRGQGTRMEQKAAGIMGKGAAAAALK
eukprot:TRINITY_DN2107_c0_g1_i1.p1 TRINITY_DN2107_c0_g1~~TRINITY_DN2107_c0_g1_i1.p1  ORF type:complete len:300 (+),score=101.77 TRINITY_DN2107_c0_g1_i1:56-901(+)